MAQKSPQIISGHRLEEYLQLMGDQNVLLPDHKINELAPGAHESRLLVWPLIQQVHRRILQKVTLSEDTVGPGGLSMLRHTKPNGETVTHLFCSGQEDEKHHNRRRKPHNVQYVEQIHGPWNTPDFVRRGWQLDPNALTIATSLRVDTITHTLDLQTGDTFGVGFPYHESTIRTDDLLGADDLFSSLKGTELYHTLAYPTKNELTRDSKNHPISDATWRHQKMPPDASNVTTVLMRKMDPHGKKIYGVEQRIDGNRLTATVSGGNHAYTSLDFYYNDRGLPLEIYYIPSTGGPAQKHTLEWFFY